MSEHCSRSPFSLCLSAKGIAEFFGNVLVQYAGIAGVTDLRNQVYAKVIRQPIGFFQHHPTGRVMSTVVNDVERVRNTFSEYLAVGFRHIFTLFFLLVVLLATSWKMTLGSVVLLPLVVWPVRTLGKRIRRSTEKIQSGMAELSQILQETISGNRVVKAFGMEDFEIGKFRESARRLLRENMRWIRAAVATSPLMDLLGAVVIVLVLMYARVQIKTGLMTAGIFVTFVYALFKSYEPVKGLGTVYQQFEQAFGATAKVFEYIGLAEEPAAEPGVRVLPPFSRIVEFDRVSFGYDPEMPILRDVSLEARAGEVIAIVGSSGAGKTTLVNLLPRFYPVTSGVLRVDGVDIREVTLRSLREQMAIVTQENDPVQRHGLEQYLLWPAGTPAGTRRSRGKSGAGARLYSRTAAGLPDDAGRSRTAAERGAAAAHRHRARDSEGFADPDPGRGDLRTRLRIRDARAARAFESDDGANCVCHRAPAFDDPPRGQDHRPRRRHDR